MKKWINSIGRNRSLAKATILFLSVTSGIAVDRYLTPLGAGTKDGTSWTNAYDMSVLNLPSDALLNTTMQPGDTLYLGSGHYGANDLFINSSGTAGSYKRIIGVDQGGGRPVFDSENWSRTNPASGAFSVLTFAGSSSYWDISNLSLRNCQRAVRTSTPDSLRTGLILRDFDIRSVEHGFYLSACAVMRIERCSVEQYTKHAFRLDRNCDRVTFQTCIADLSSGDTTWWDYAENLPFGFTIGSGGANTNIVFNDCIANNNRWNNQSSSTYWNGDGFSVEENTVGVTRFNRCIANNNEDAGFDIKPAAVFTDCVAVRNYRGFRCWDSVKTFDNCVATFPFRRSTSYPNGQANGSGIWVQDGAATVSYFTFHGDAGIGIEVEGGNVELEKSVLSFSGVGSNFTSGQVTTNLTVFYRLGNSDDPNFINPLPDWDGHGTAMDNQLYGSAKGYFYFHPEQDPDADGSVNHDERLAGTDPRNGASIFRIVAAHTVDNQFEIRFTSVLQRQYQLERKDSLASGFWTQVAEDIGTGNVMQLRDTNGFNATSFYRMAVTP